MSLDSFPSAGATLRRAVGCVCLLGTGSYVFAQSRQSVDITMTNSWTDSSYAKIITNAERILKQNKYIHNLLQEESIQANYGRAHYNTKYPLTRQWHMQKQDKEWACTIAPSPEDDKLKKQPTLLSVLNTFFARFMSDKLLEYHDLDTHKYISPHVQHVMYHDIPAFDLSDSQMLRWMVNLVVDLHYPFNLGFPKSPEEEIQARHNLDSDSLARHFQKLQDSIILPDVQVADYDEDISDHHPFELFHKWAQATAKKSCEIYKDLLTPDSSVMMSPGDQDSSNNKIGGLPKVFNVGPTYQQKWQTLLTLQMEEAARHTVIFLRNIAVHKHHKKQNAAGKGRHHPRKYWKRDLMKNLCVACFVVPSFLWLMKQFEQQKSILHLLASDRYKDGWGKKHESEMRKL